MVSSRRAAASNEISSESASSRFFGRSPPCRRRQGPPMSARAEPSSQCHCRLRVGLRPAGMGERTLPVEDAVEEAVFVVVVVVEAARDAIEFAIRELADADSF
jgi:hypothetical protein